MLPAPAARGSSAERQELTQLHALIAAASPQRLAQAKWDGDHEDAAVFNDIVGRDLAKLPQTWALLAAVQHEAEAAVVAGKVYFARLRPYAIDETVPRCEGGSAKPSAKSYPSGHAGFGWSVGYALAQLMPNKGPAILARAADYALSRELCGVHFHSDTQASQVVGTLVAAKLLADPRFAARITAARAELVAP